MTVEELCGPLNLTVLTDGGGLNKEVSGGYTGDLLSWVMARLPADAAWLTVIGNVNAVAVAYLKDAACIILTDSAPLDEDARAKAQQQGVAILSSELGSYELGAKLMELLR